MISKIFQRLSDFSTYIYSLAICWQQKQIESLSNAYLATFKYDEDCCFEEQTRYVYKSQSLLQICKEMRQVKTACEDQLLMVIQMLKYMGLSEKGACQYLQLLRKLPDNDNSVTYIKNLCEIWHKYKMMNVMNDENIWIDKDGVNMIKNVKTILFNTFHYSLSELLNINEGADAILEMHNKHQLDILKNLELQLLTNAPDVNESTSQLVKSLPNLLNNDLLTKSLPQNDSSYKSERTTNSKESCRTMLSA